ncbi:hypothetical protein ABZ721_31730 [Streptomyces sp. NPDC006733]|uniref:hypothetical protein n=1 Tax=Streptomyces sp. NPDC006733 TaxID=3155460 RepID=UPI0033DDACDA
MLLAVVVTMAGIQDRDAGLRLLTSLRSAGSTITLGRAGGGCAGRRVTWAKAVLGVTVEVVKRTDDMKGFVVLPRRWAVERKHSRSEWTVTERAGPALTGIRSAR